MQATVSVLVETEDTLKGILQQWHLGYQVEVLMVKTMEEVAAVAMFLLGAEQTVQSLFIINTFFTLVGLITI